MDEGLRPTCRWSGRGYTTTNEEKVLLEETVAPKGSETGKHLQALQAMTKGSGSFSEGPVTCM